MTTYNTNTDLNARGQQIARTRAAAQAGIWRLFEGLPALFARTPADPARDLARMERREAARRAADNLLR